MYELGKKDQIFGADKLERLDVRYFNTRGEPTSFPILQEDTFVVCGYDQGLGERIIICESLEDMQQLYATYARGSALSIKWYTAKDPGFITIL